MKKNKITIDYDEYQKLLTENQDLLGKCNEYQQLKETIKKANEYLTSYESIHTIQFGTETDSEKDKTNNIGLDLVTMECMTIRYLKVQNNLLNILNDEVEIIEETSEYERGLKQGKFDAKMDTIDLIEKMKQIIEEYEEKY